MTLPPAIPATARERIEVGTRSRSAARSISTSPGASRVMTRRVASGVTSRGEKPGAAGGDDQVDARRDGIAQRIGDDVEPRPGRPTTPSTRKPSSASSDASSGPDVSARTPPCDAVGDRDHAGERTARQSRS